MGKQPLYAATVMIFIAVFSAGFSYGTEPHDQKQLKNRSGEAIPDSLLEQNIIYWEDCAPWIRSYTTGYSRYVRPNDPIIRWFAERVKLTPGEGFFFKKTGNRLNIVYVNDSDAHPGYADYWQDITLTGVILQGDCEDLSTFMCSLLIAKGYPAMVVRGCNKTTHQGHMWVEHKVNDKIYIIDFDRYLPRVSKYLGYDGDYMFNDVSERTSYDPNW